MSVPRFSLTPPPRPYRIASDLGMALGDGGSGDQSFTLDEAKVKLNWLIEHEYLMPGERIMEASELAGIRARAMGRLREQGSGTP